MVARRGARENFGLLFGFLAPSLRGMLHEGDVHEPEIQSARSFGRRICNPDGVREEKNHVGVQNAFSQTKNTERGKLYETFIVFGTNGIIDGQLLLTGIVPSCSEAGGSLRPIQDGAER